MIAKIGFVISALVGVLTISIKKQFIFFLIIPSVVGFWVSFGDIIDTCVSLIALVYGFSPAFIRAEKLYNKNYANLIVEFGLLKKFLFITIAILIFGNIFIFFTNNQPNLISINYSSKAFLFAVIAAFVRTLLIIGKKDFGFYFSKGYCQIISEKDDEGEKMRNLFLLLKSYNRYIKQNLKIEITDIVKLYTLILYKDKDERDQIIQSMCKTLETNKFNLAKYLRLIYTKPESFYSKSSIFGELKLISAVLATAIPIIISIFQLI